MFRVIHQSFLILIKFLLLMQLSSCNENNENALFNPYKSYDKAQIILPSGERLQVYIAKTNRQQQLGLSHIKDEDFKDNESMLFPAKSYSLRQFWMPNTHFDLDIFFLNEDFYVLDMHRNLQHYPKSGPRKDIPLSKTVECMHVLEVKSSSSLAKEIQPGMILKWSGLKSL